MYCAFLDLRDMAKGATSAALSDVIRKVTPDRIPNVRGTQTSTYANKRMSLRNAERHLSKLIDCGLIRFNRMVRRRGSAGVDPGGWRAHRTVFGCLIGPVPGTVYVPEVTKAWVEATLAETTGAGGHGGRRWSKSARPDVAAKLSDAQRRGGEAEKARWARIRAGLEAPGDAADRRAAAKRKGPEVTDIAEETLGGGYPIKTSGGYPVKGSGPTLSRDRKNTKLLDLPSPVGSSSKNLLARLDDEAVEAARGEDPPACGGNSVGGSCAKTPPSAPLASSDDLPGGSEAPGLLGAILDSEDMSWVDDDGPTKPAGPRHAVSALEDLGLPVLPPVFGSGLTVVASGAPLLVPEDTLERKVELVRRAWEGAVTVFAGKPRPKELGHPRPLRPSKSGWWPLLSKAVAAFEARGIAPAAWCAYVLDIMGDNHPNGVPTMRFALSEKLITTPRGFFSGPSTDYTSRRDIILPEVRSYMERRATLHEEAAVMVDPTREKLEALVQRSFPEGLDELLRGLRERVASEQSEVDSRLAAGRWVWEPRSGRPTKLKRVSAPRGSSSRKLTQESPEA